LLTKKQAAFNDIRVTQDLSDDIPMICLDKGQIQQALINLLINAVEATRSGGHIHVATRYLEGFHMAEIEISDNGIGMSEEIIGRIFDPFYTNKETGTGLGLAITHGIIQQHNGTISVVSRVGEGSTFTIRLPFDCGEDHG
jgi:two-component system, NtrC family, sensor kinase